MTGLSRSPDAEAPPGHLVLVSRTDTSGRRSDAAFAHLKFYRSFHNAVVWQDQVTAIRYKHPAFDFDACFGKNFQFFDQSQGI